MRVIPLKYSNFVADINLFKKIGYHPVHILNSNGNFSPSAFIPFCSFGEDILGVKVKEFDIPVCNIFKPKLQYDQLCYEIDLEQLKNTEDTNIRDLQRDVGLIIVLDYNEDRQINMNKISFVSLKQNGITKTINKKIKNSVSSHLDTLGIFIKIFISSTS